MHNLVMHKDQNVSVAMHVHRQEQNFKYEKKMHGRASGYLDNDVLAQVGGLFTAMVRQIYIFLHLKSHYRIDKKTTQCTC